MWGDWGYTVDYTFTDSCAQYQGRRQCVPALEGDVLPDPFCLQGFVRRCIVPRGYCATLGGRIQCVGAILGDPPDPLCAAGFSRQCVLPRQYGYRQYGRGW